MKLETSKGKAKAAAAKYKRQYLGEDTYRTVGQKWMSTEKLERRESVYVKLSALTEPTPEAVNEIMGGDGWTECYCNECDRSVPATVELGDEPDWESATADICEDCLRKAIALFPKPAPQKNTTTLTWHKTSEFLPESGRHVWERPKWANVMPECLRIMPGTLSRWVDGSGREVAAPEEWTYVDGAIANG